MTLKLFLRAIIKFILGILLVGAMLFLPAWTLHYPNAWLFMGILFIPMFVVGIVLMMKNPELLRKRLNAKEKQNEQSLVGLLGEYNTQTVYATKLRDLIGNENPCQLCLPCVSLWTKVRVGIALLKGSPPFDIYNSVDCAMGLIGNSQ